MNSKQELREVNVFKAFLKARRISVHDEHIETREPPEPDILYNVNGFETAFELTEICSSELPKMADYLKKTGKDSEACWINDPTRETIWKKLYKSYKTQYPIELLFYTAGRTASPDEMILSVFSGFQTIFNKHVFINKIWLLAERPEPYLIYDQEK